MTTDSLRAGLEQRRQKALKLLDAITEDCDVRTDGDHDWHKCRACLARFELDEKGPRELLRVVADLLRAQPHDLTPQECVADCYGCRQLRAELDTLRGMREEWRAKIGRAQPPPAPDPERTARDHFDDGIAAAADYLARNYGKEAAEFYEALTTQYWGPILPRLEVAAIHAVEGTRPPDPETQP